jgi:hypothetical protein
MSHVSERMIQRHAQILAAERLHRRPPRLQFSILPCRHPEVDVYQDLKRRASGKADLVLVLHAH